jgi:hypothetical protein
MDAKNGLAYGRHNISLKIFKKQKTQVKHAYHNMKMATAKGVKTLWTVLR